MRITREPMVPGTTTKLLTDTSKMPCKSWSLPAGTTCPDAVKGESPDGRPAVCNGCYAEKGTYAWEAVKGAQNKRLAWTVQCMKSPEGRAQWVEYMTAAIDWATRNKEPIFRVHDSGDLYSVTYAACWIKVCRNLPHIHFWFPTRAWNHGQSQFNALKEAAILQLAALPNTTVRPSAIYVGDAPPVVPGFAAGTGVGTDGYSCPASSQDGKCLDCRACWYSPLPVVYHLH